MPFKQHMWHTHLVSFCSCMQSRRKFYCRQQLKKQQWMKRMEGGGRVKSNFQCGKLFSFTPMSTTAEQKNCHQELNYGSLNTCDIYHREIHIDETSFTIFLLFLLIMIKINNFIENWIDCAWLLHAVITRRYF